MIVSYVKSATWLLFVLILISQIVLFICSRYIDLLSIYFVFVAIVLLFLYLIRSSHQDFIYNDVISPTDGVITGVENNRTTQHNHKNYTGLVLYIKSGLLDEWSKVSPVSGQINYVRYYEDIYNNRQILSIAIQTQHNLHLLQFILKSSIGHVLFKLQNNLYEGCTVYAGQIIVIVPLYSELQWFIECNNNYEFNIPKGRKLNKYEYIPLLQKIKTNTLNNASHKQHLKQDFTLDDNA